MARNVGQLCIMSNQLLNDNPLRDIIQICGSIPGRRHRLLLITEPLATDDHPLVAGQDTHGSLQDGTVATAPSTWTISGASCADIVFTRVGRFLRGS